jgi:pyruvate/2-oxoglutarate dehydrogenase complex dihydrolipoamide dehydrogenase (E3) component
MHYDTLIIGAGQAATPLASALAKAGRAVAVAERAHAGGSCINFGCTPTKAAIASAKLAHMARRAADYGVRLGGVDVDFPAVLSRARRIAGEMRSSLEESFGGEGKPALLKGQARLKGRSDRGLRVAIGGDEATAERVVLDTGTRTLVPPIDGLDDVAFLDAGNWLDQDELPRHLAIVGGGYIGLEMAQLYRRLGSRVTVIEGGGQIAGHEDEDVAGALATCCARRRSTSVSMRGPARWSTATACSA